MANGVLQALDGRGRWLCQITVTADDGSLERFTAERAEQWVRDAAGIDTLDVDVLSIGLWQLNAPAVTDDYSDYLQSATPGARAPHPWLGHADSRFSTLDLIGTGFTLFAGPNGPDVAQRRERGRCAHRCPDRALSNGRRRPHRLG